MNSKDKRNLVCAILIVFIAVYLSVPPYNKIAQIGYAFNNIIYMLRSKDTDAYIYHRNNAIYLVRMSNEKGAMAEMDKSIASFPVSEYDNSLSDLYRDRAKMRIYYRDYKGALNDLLKIDSPSMNDNLAIAMLLKELGKRKLAVSYCNKIIDIDLKAYAGYACIADIYGSIGKYDASVMIYDLLIDRSPNKPRYYMDRALYKEKAGDKSGAEQDYKKAQELSSNISKTDLITYTIIHPKRLELFIR